MQTIKVYETTLTVESQASSLDEIGAALKGRPWDPKFCFVSDDAAREAALIAKRDSSSWGTAGVSALGAERATRDATTLTALGFTVPPPLFAVGSLVNQTGVENAKRKRLAFEALPALKPALYDFRAKILSENRRDIVVDAPEKVRLRDNGELMLPSGECFVFDEASFEQFAKRLALPKGAGTYLASVEPDMRAWNVTEWLRRNKAEPFMLRVRNGHEVYACVSPKYVGYDVSVIAIDLWEALKDVDGLRGTVDYDGKRVQIDALAHSDIAPERYVAGEVFQVGTRVATADDGTGSCKGGGTALRNLCLNLIVVASIQAGTFSVAHRGSRDAFQKAIREGFDGSTKAAKAFVKLWNSDEQVRDLRGSIKPEDGEAVVPSGADDYSVNQLMWGLFVAEQKRLPLGQRELAPVMAAWKKEPEVSRKGVANALTRYAHEGQANAWHADELERAAGEVLTSKRPFVWADPSAIQKRVA
jgi:hypothetical protein